MLSIFSSIASLNINLNISIFFMISPNNKEVSRQGCLIEEISLITEQNFGNDRFNGTNLLKDFSANKS